MSVYFTRRGEAPKVFPVFANNTWEQVIMACQSGEVPDTWEIGDQMKMTIDGKSYLVDIIGKNHDTYADGSGKAPLTFQLRDSFETPYNINGSATKTLWESSPMRTTHIPTIKDVLPTEVKSAIRQVNKLSATASSTVKTVKDDLFLLSEVEVFGTNTYSYSGEGTQYAYYANGGSKKKKWDGSNYGWWLRSMYSGSTGVYVSITSSGTVDYYSVTNSFGVSFAFCF